MPSSHLILCRPLLLLPSFFPGIRVFSSELALCIRWPKYWSFSFSLSLPHFKKVFIYFWLCWVFVAARRLPLVMVSRGCSLAVVEDSLWWLLLGNIDSRACRLQRLRDTGFVAPWHVESSWTRDRTCIPCIGRQFLSYRTTRKAPSLCFYCCIFFKLFYPSLTQQSSKYTPPHC